MTSKTSKLAVANEEEPKTLGMSPASLLNRRDDRKGSWCPKPGMESDPNCNTNKSKTITHEDIEKALPVVREKLEKTTLQLARDPEKFGCNLYYKIETLHFTGSFKERGVLVALNSLTQQQKDGGVITVSLGNVGMALAYHTNLMRIKTRVIFPKSTSSFTVKKCKGFGAKVFLRGENFKEARQEALAMAEAKGLTFINGYVTYLMVWLHAPSCLRRQNRAVQVCSVQSSALAGHTHVLPAQTGLCRHALSYDDPNIIAGDGTIGLEILEDLPEVEFIIVPVGGGALIAGIAATVKHINPEVKIYGVEPSKSCCFFKALEKDGVFETEIGQSLASSLAIETAGCNALETAKSLVDKMILVDDDWIARAVCYLAEEEKLAVEGAGATSLSVLFAMPNVLPELHDKNVVCVVTGGNWNYINLLPKCMERAKALEGRLIKLVMDAPADDTKYITHILSMIANTGASVSQCHVEHAWITNNNLRNMNLHLTIECQNLEHACTLKRVMEKLFPDQCDFLQEPFSSLPICICFPKQ